jgi:hypothetical protein
VQQNTFVQVTLADKRTLQADAVVCTLPLGILQQKGRNAVTFDPPLPAEKQKAIKNLGTGLLNKCALSFPVKFWQDSDFLGLADEHHSYLVLNAALYTGKPVLVFMYGGDFAKEIESWTDADIVQDCLDVLKRICGRSNIPSPVDYQVTRWGHEQYSRMAFTYIPPGVEGFAELEAMSRPVYDHTGTVPVLMFAGEHTTPYHPSTIHGAFLSGIREAYRLDCTLDPVGNDNLVFSDDQLYQRTFFMKRRKFRRGKSSPPEVQAPPPPPRAQQRRTVVVGDMTLRRRPKTVFNPPTQPKNASGPSSRRSQRSSKGSHGFGFGFMVVNGDHQENGTRAGRTGAVSPVPTEQTRELLAALEDRVLLRGVENYGRDYAFLRTASLPVYGSSSVKSVQQIKQRCLKLLPQKARPSVNIKPWLAGKVVPPTTYAQAIENEVQDEEETEDPPARVERETTCSVARVEREMTRSGRRTKPRVLMDV